MLAQIKLKVQSNQISLGEAIAQALPSLRAKVSDERLNWLANELQGYPHALDFYQGLPSSFPPYRVVNGKLKVMDIHGQLYDVDDPIAKREQFFLAAPISWLEDSEHLPGEITLVELPELNTYLKKMAGNAVCEVSKDQIQRILRSFQASFSALIDEVLLSMPTP